MCEAAVLLCWFSPCSSWLNLLFAFNCCSLCGLSSGCNAVVRNCLALGVLVWLLWFACVCVTRGTIQMFLIDWLIDWYTVQKWQACWHRQQASWQAFYCMPSVHWQACFCTRSPLALRGNISPQKYVICVLPRPLGGKLSSMSVQALPVCWEMFCFVLQCRQLLIFLQP